jgi:endonuclease-8
MPEGPSLVILKEQIMQFKGRKVLAVSGNSKTDVAVVLNKKLLDIKTWGKHLLICFNGITVRIHLMMFGSYRINEEKDAVPRLSLKFTNGFLNFYTCSVKLLEEPPDELYDWSEDIMSDEWDAAAAKKKLKANPDMLVCDALLDQHLFSGSGNIIKNEVLFRTRIHPLSKAAALPTKKLNEVTREARNYAFDFLEWKKEGTLKKHWLAYTKKTCPRCDVPLHKEYLGKTKRRTFFCENCQELYG